jgi:phenylalanyl-tRNA synthetase beta chain
LGTSFTEEEIKNVFDRLCFTYTLNEGNFDVVVPSYRNDITMDADLIEEVARLYGYDNLPSTLPEMSMTQGLLTDKQSKEKLMRHMLAHLGLHETLTYTLTSPSKENDFNLFHNADDQVKLMWPLGEERSVTRKSLIPHLLEVIKYNNDHAIKDVHIFEIANTYSAQEKEISELAIAMSGNYVDVPWLGEKTPVDFYVVKGILETLFKALNIEPSRYTLEKVEADNKDYHPGRSAYIKVGKTIVGLVGQIHPAKAKKYEVNDTYVVTLNLTALLSMRSSKIKFTSLPQYPSVDRDIALVVDKDVPASEIERTIFRASKILKSTTIFDVYEGEHVEEGKKSVAISMMFQDEERTLDEKTINEAMDKVLSAVEKAFHAKLRQ